MIKVIGTGKNYSKNLIDSLLSFNKTSTWTVSSGSGSAVCSTEDSFDGLQSLKITNSDLSADFITTNAVQNTEIIKSGDYGLVISIKKPTALEVITLRVNIYKNAVLEYSTPLVIGNKLDASLDDTNIWVRYMTESNLALSSGDIITLTFQQEADGTGTSTYYVDGIHLYTKDNEDTLAPLYSEPLSSENYAYQSTLEIVSSVATTQDVDWNKTTKEYTLTADTTLTDINLPSYPQTMSIHITGEFVLTLPSYYNITGMTDYDGTVWNILVLDYYNDGTDDVVRGALTVIN